MRLKIRSYTQWKHDRFIAKEVREQTWNTWFAWRPVFINYDSQCNTLVWMETIVRKKSFNGWIWHYSLSCLSDLRGCQDDGE